MCSSHGLDRARSVRRLAEKDDQCDRTALAVCCGSSEGTTSTRRAWMTTQETRCALAMTEVLVVADEVPAVDPRQCVPQHTPPPSSGHAAATTQAAGSAQDVTAPYQAMPPILLPAQRRVLIRTRCNTRRLEEVCLSTMWTLNVSMRHMTTCGKEVADSAVPVGVLRSV